MTTSGSISLSSFFCKATPHSLQAVNGFVPRCSIVIAAVQGQPACVDTMSFQCWRVAIFASALAHCAANESPTSATVNFGLTVSPKVQKPGFLTGCNTLHVLLAASPASAWATASAGINGAGATVFTSPTNRAAPGCRSSNLTGLPGACPEGRTRRAPPALPRLSPSQAIAAGTGQKPAPAAPCPRRKPW